MTWSVPRACCLQFLEADHAVAVLIHVLEVTLSHFIAHE